MRIFKSNPVLTLVNSYLIDSPQPSTISYLWNFGSLLGLCLIAQIISGILISMHYAGTAELAFTSVEHIMRDVNNGWLLRVCHANMASFFFICVYLHISRGLYYNSYRSPRTGVWVVGTIIFFLMMATAFLGYVLPFGQMSLWGEKYSLRSLVKNWNNKRMEDYIYYIMPLYSTDKNKYKGLQRIGPHNYDIISIIFGGLLGDAHGEKRKDGIGTRITFYQESTHVEYIIWLHKIISKLGYSSPIEPEVTIRNEKKGCRKSRKIIRFRTWTYVSFNWIYEIWYDENRKKKVPLSIGRYLSPLALAIWIMDDGSKVGEGLKFSTNCFSKSDCLLLISVLEKNFNLKCSIQLAGISSKDQYIIYVWKESMPLLRKIVDPNIIPEMKYKIQPDINGK